MEHKQNDRLGDWITTAAAAEILQLTTRRVRQLAEQGVVRHKMITRRLMMVSQSDVKRYKDAQE